jgi:flagellar basal body rod protein FlgB
MLIGILGRATNANDIKDALDLSAQRTRVIAGRVAQASVGGANGFALPLDPATGQPIQGGDEVDLEQEMTSLADEQVRFEATAKLLEKTYAQLRTAIKDK